LKTKEDLHTKVIIGADSSWRNEFTGDGKQAADYVTKVDPDFKDPIEELSEDQQGRVGERWGEILAWRDKWFKKHRNNTMTDQDLVDYKKELDQLRKDLS
jgi:hypothetical protein